MAALKKKLGRCDCPICKKVGVVMLKLNEAGTVTWACDDCDSVGFAKAGTEGAAILKAKTGVAPEAKSAVAPEAKTAVAPAAKPAMAPEQKPVPVRVRKPATPFDFLGA